MFFICTLDTSEVVFVTYNLNYILHAVSVGIPSERMSNFWMVFNRIIIIIIISGFGTYSAAVVLDSGVGNTWQRLTLILHEFLSNGLIPSRLHIVISFFLSFFFSFFSDIQFSAHP